jgi:propionyl-CoA synthetase
MQYEELYRESLENPEAFWGRAAEQVHWDRKWDSVLDVSNLPFVKWFSGAVLNTCYNAVDYHVQHGRGSQNAIVYDSPVTDTIRRFTYAELKERVSRIAGFLTELGVKKGETVLIYMPMIPETLMAMLACARIGAIHSVVFGGFAPRELAIRIDDLRPRVVLSASCGIEAQRIIPYKPLLDGAIGIAVHSPEKVVMYQRPQVTAELQNGRDLEWTELESKAAVQTACLWTRMIPCTSFTHPEPRQTQRGGSRQRRTCSRDEVVDEARLQH